MQLNTGSSTSYNMKKWNNQIQSYIGLSESVNDLFKQQTLIQLKLAQSDTVLYKWLTAMCYKGKPVTRHMTIEKAKSFYDEVPKTDKLSFSEDRSKKLPVRT